jgi:hypothetical protein
MRQRSINLKNVVERPWKMRRKVADKASDLGMGEERVQRKRERLANFLN